MLPDPNSYQSVGWLLLSLAALSLGCNQILKLVDRARGRQPDPLLVQSHATLAERVTKLEEDARDISVKLSELQIKLLEAGEERGSKLHHRLNPIAENLAAVKGSMEALLLAFQENARTNLEMIRAFGK